jgi:gas vesicle protein
MILDMANHIQYRRHSRDRQEQIKETIEALYKHQSETKDTINREKNELRTKIDNIKEEVIQDMENLKNRTKQKCKTK